MNNSTGEPVEPIQIGDLLQCKHELLNLVDDIEFKRKKKEIDNKTKMQLSLWYSELDYVTKLAKELP